MAFVKLTVSEGRDDWVLVDHISEVITQRSSAVPFDECGSLVILTTRREVSVRETPQQILDKISAVIMATDGYFSSEDDE